MDLNSPIFDRIGPSRRQRSPSRLSKYVVTIRLQRGGRVPRAQGWQREGEYFSFCLEHVRAYNASYNYFQGMSAEAVSLYQRDASTGHRPTWVMGDNIAGGPQGRGADPAHYADPLNIFGGARAARKAQEPPKPKHGIAARKALDQLGLDESADPTTIRSRYKDMVKRLHPDANGGDRSLEDKLREIIRAYSYLKSVKLA